MKQRVIIEETCVMNYYSSQLETSPKPFVADTIKELRRSMFGEAR